MGLLALMNTLIGLWVLHALSYLIKIGYYQTYYNLSITGTLAFKYVNGNFYFTSDNSFYSTKMNFKTTNNYKSGNYYREMY